MKRKRLCIALPAVLIGLYLFFCPCINEGLYELIAIYPTHEPINLFEPYDMNGFIGDHKFINAVDPVGRKIVLHGIYFKAKTNHSGAVALFSKGNGFCVRHFLGAKPLLVLLNLGYDVFIYDYQGFGSSIGIASYKYLGDNGVAAFDYLKNTMKKDKIFLYGMSMGTGVSSYIAERRPALGVILDSPFTTPEHTLKNWCPPLSVYPSSFFPKPHYDNEEFVKGKHPPTLILTKGHDEVTSPDQGLRLASIGAPPIASLFMPKSFHCYVDCEEETIYSNTLKDFLAKIVH